MFLTEAGLSPDAGSIKTGDFTIESILEEKKIFDLSLRFEKCGTEGDRGWTLPGRYFTADAVLGKNLTFDFAPTSLPMYL